MKNPQILKELKKQFTLLTVDFYNDGESVETFVFRADELSEDKAFNLYNDYDKKYESNEYDGAFEDYLKENGIEYDII